MIGRRWPTLICPECDSRTCSEDATQYQSDIIYVSCEICRYCDVRLMFSRMSEADFAVLVRQLNAPLLGS